MTAGALYERVRFEAPAPTDDGYGGVLDGWSDEFTVSAGVTYLRAGETVLQGRMQGRNTVSVRVRRSTDSLRIRTDWRAVDTRSGVVMAVRSIIPTLDRAFLDLTCETGVQP